MFFVQSLLRDVSVSFLDLNYFDLIISGQH